MKRIFKQTNLLSSIKALSKVSASMQTRTLFASTLAVAVVSASLAAPIVNSTKLIEELGKALHSEVLTDLSSNSLEATSYTMSVSRVGILNALRHNYQYMCDFDQQEVFRFDANLRYWKDATKLTWHNDRTCENWFVTFIPTLTAASVFVGSALSAPFYTIYGFSKMDFHAFLSNQNDWTRCAVGDQDCKLIKEIRASQEHNALSNRHILDAVAAVNTAWLDSVVQSSIEISKKKGLNNVKDLRFLIETILKMAQNIFYHKYPERVQNPKDLPTSFNDQIEILFKKRITHLTRDTFKNLLELENN